MTQSEADDRLAQAIEAIDSGQTFAGMEPLEGLISDAKELLYYSYLAVNIARKRKEPQQALGIMRQVQEAEPTNTLHYLNLGRIHLACGNKPDAIKAFRNGLLFGADRRISAELDNLGWRRLPVISSLPRQHFLNVLLGTIRDKLSGR